MQEQSSVSLGEQPHSPKTRKNIKSIISNFSKKILEIPGVLQVSVYESHNNPDVYVVYNSKTREARHEIYLLAQNILLTDPDNPMDFHTINLNDFDPGEWPRIIPHDAIRVYKKRAD